MKNNLDSIFSIAKNFKESEIETTTKSNGSYLTVYSNITKTKGDISILLSYRIELYSTKVGEDNISVWGVSDCDNYDTEVFIAGMNINTSNFVNKLNEVGLSSEALGVESFTKSDATEEEITEAVKSHPDFIKFFGGMENKGDYNKRMEMQLNTEK